MSVGDSITALGFAVCFYYGFTGLACAWYYRRDVFKSVRRFVLVGLAPLVGGGLMFAIFAKAFHDYGQADGGASSPLFGIQVSRKTEVAQEGLLDAPVEHAGTYF